MKTAVLVDGAFFIYRSKVLYPEIYRDPTKMAKTLHEMCLKHLKQRDGNEIFIAFLFMIARL